MEQKLPHNFYPRPYQRPLFDAFLNGTKRMCCVWHRRGGKDTAAMHIAAIGSQQEIGNYWHMLPEQRQGRRVVWEAINKKGQRMLDATFPSWMVEGDYNNTEMLVRFKNGSTYQVLGSDNYNSAVGANPKGIIFSEYSLANPDAWAYLRPILVENDGWAIFIYTPRGRNHGYSLYKSASANDRWFCQLLDARQTGVLSEEELENEYKEYIEHFGRTEGISRFNSEYLCRFETAISGATFGEFLEQAEREHRVTSVPWNPKFGVNTFWDLGRRDSTSIWFMQYYDGAPHFIDYYEGNLVSLDHYVKMLYTKPYTYVQHVLPHDGKQIELIADKSRVDALIDLGLRPVVALERPKDINVKIDAGRNLLRIAKIDKTNCEQGLNALASNHRIYNSGAKAFSSAPVHDWSSHGCDAFCYAGMAQDKWVGEGLTETKFWTMSQISMPHFAV